MTDITDLNMSHRLQEKLQINRLILKEETN